MKYLTLLLIKIKYFLAKVQTLELKDKFTIIGIFLSTIGVTFSSIALFLNFLSYKKTQDWKRAEFIANQVSTFRKNNELVLSMLDYSSRKIKLFKDDNSDSLYAVDSEVLFNALDTDTTENAKPKGLVLLQIRDLFDKFLYDLGIFNNYIEADLISKEELEPYIDYWLSIITVPYNKHKSNNVVYRIWDYINIFKYDKVKQLCDKYNHSTPIAHPAFNKSNFSIPPLDSIPLSK